MTKYEIKNTTQFKKDYKLAKKRGLNIKLLKEVVSKLANVNIKIICYQEIGVDIESVIYNQIGFLFIM